MWWMCQKLHYTNCLVWVPNIKKRAKSAKNAKSYNIQDVLNALNCLVWVSSHKKPANSCDIYKGGRFSWRSQYYLEDCRESGTWNLKFHGRKVSQRNWCQYGISQRLCTISHLDWILQFKVWKIFFTKVFKFSSSWIFYWSSAMLGLEGGSWVKGTAGSSLSWPSWSSWESCCTNSTVLAVCCTIRSWSTGGRWSSTWCTWSSPPTFWMTAGRAVTVVLG